MKNIARITPAGSSRTGLPAGWVVWVGPHQVTTPASPDPSPPATPDVISVSGVVVTFSVATRRPTVTWTNPSSGSVTVQRADSNGFTETATLSATSGGYLFNTAAGAASTSTTVTVTAGSSSATDSVTYAATPATPAGSPDLVVTGVSSSPVSPTAGDPVTFSAVVKNQGTADTPSGVVIGVAFAVDGTKVSWSDTSSTALAVGASRTLTANSGPTGSAVWSATAGAHTIVATVDDIGRISESNDTNNTASLTVTVATGGGTVTTPVATGGTFNALTFGASVTGVKEGQFNTWTGKRLGLAATWGGNGKVWAVDIPSNEYGANSIPLLGNYDLDVAPQREITSWSDAASGGQDATWRADLTELKSKWGSRTGHIYYRPWHEFNGTWYQWSTRSTADQANFKSAWIRLFNIWTSLGLGADARFHLEWSPNRDSSYGLDVRNAFPGAQYVDVVGPDYYDFSRANTDALWTAEVNKTQNGGSPIGLGAWQAFSASVGLPIQLPEYGVQFGDNPLFVTKTTDLIWANRYTGSGSAAGKFVGFAWHNLQGSSPDPNAGGDFFVQKNGADYTGRPNTSRTMREWVQSHAIRTV